MNVLSYESGFLIFMVVLVVAGIVGGISARANTIARLVIAGRRWAAAVRAGRQRIPWDDVQ